MRLNAILLVVSLIMLLQLQYLQAQLQVGYYSGSCNMAEFIVKDEVTKAFFQDRGLAAGLVRLHFHDCFVRVRSHNTLFSSPYKLYMIQKH